MKNYEKKKNTGTSGKLLVAVFASNVYVCNDIFVPLCKRHTVNTYQEVTIRVYTPLMIDIDAR